jgi:integrase
MNPTDALSRYRLFKKGAYGTFYIEDVLSRRQTSLKTKDKKEAERLCQAHCECAEAPDRAYRVGMAYVGSIDPDAATRTWKQVVEAYAANHPEGSPTRYRIEIAGKDRAIACLLRLPLLRTRPDELLSAVNSGTVSTNTYLRRFQNFALDLGWLPKPILPKKRWPKVRHQPKRAITEEEHQRILTRETNPERRAFYQFCWYLGGASTDVATLQASNIDWRNRTISYNRKKTAQLTPFQSVDACLKELNTYIEGWGAYFRICDHEAIRSWRGLDAHVRRRVRAIAIRQQKRPRFLFRHLVRNGASEGTAAKTAWSSRGVWHKSARFGVHEAYGLAWFIGCLNSLEGQWLKHHRPAASGSQMSFAF